MHCHLVAVEVRVERRADQRMQLDGLAFDQHRLERLNAEPMQSGRTIEQNRMLADHLVEDIPNFRLLFLDQLLGLLHRGGETFGVEARIDERLEQLERHLLRQAALMQLEFGTDHDHRAAGIVDALAEQVLTEPALLAFEHIGERLQRTFVGARDDAAATAVVEQRIDRFLKHALLVADDDVRRAQFDQPLEAVVAVYDAAVEIVQVGGRKTTAIERNERAQIRRDHRHLRQDHPLGLVVRLGERLDQLEALCKPPRLQAPARLRDLDAQVGGELLKVECAQHVADRFRADLGGEAVVAVFVLRLEELVLRQELTLFQGRDAGLDHDVIFEVKDALEILQRHVKQQSDAARQRLEEPDVRNRRGELDVAHALTTNAREGHLDAALLADDSLVLHALVLAAQALVILDRPENAGAEQAVTLGLERAVVDRLRLFDLAVRPGQNLLGARDGNPDLVEDLRRNLRAEEVHDFLIHHRLLGHLGGPKFTGNAVRCRPPLEANSGAAPSPLP